MNPSSGVALARIRWSSVLYQVKGSVFEHHSLVDGDLVMDAFDQALGNRLATLEASVSVPGRLPDLNRPTQRHVGVSLVVGAFLALVVAATAVGSVVLVSNLVRGYPGIESPGQPLAGADLECMSPPRAAAFLAGHGYAGVVWEVTPSAGAGYETTTPPEHGYVVPGAIGGDGVLHMVIDQRAGGGVGACAGKPMP
jgi:hypothetical protein